MNSEPVAAVRISESEEVQRHGGKRDKIQDNSVTSDIPEGVEGFVGENPPPNRCFMAVPGGCSR